MDAEKLMMQRRIDNLCERLKKVERERDALMYDMQLLTVKNEFCAVCKYCNPNEETCSSITQLSGNCFAWRGLCKENGGATDD